MGHYSDEETNTEHGNKLPIKLDGEQHKGL